MKTAILSVILCFSATACTQFEQRSPAEQSPRIVEDFPKPAPLKNDPSVILLQISIADGDLYFVSLDKPDWHDIHLGPQHITAERGDVLLQADQLQWDLGQTTVTLKDRQVVLNSKQSNGEPTQIVFKPFNGFIDVSENGRWMRSGKDALVKIDAKSGKLICF